MSNHRMKIVALNGSPRIGITARALETIACRLESKGFGTTILHLKDYNIEPCRGCYLCFLKGGDHCPIDDDTTSLWQDLSLADAVIISSPVYALGIPGGLKNFIDRIAWHSHRPDFQGKPALLLASTAGMGTGQVLSQLSWIHLLGYRIVARYGFMKFPHVRDSQKKEAIGYRKLISAADKLASALSVPVKEKPSLLRIVQFNALRVNVALAPEVYAADSEYYKDKTFFVPWKIPIVKEILGKLFFLIALRTLKARLKEPVIWK